MKWIAYGVASISIASAIWISASAAKLGFGEIARVGAVVPQAGLYKQNGNQKKSAKQHGGAKSQLQQQKRRVTKNDSFE